MWIEVKPVDHPVELLWFGSGMVVGVSPGATGAVLVFNGGGEMLVENTYSELKAKLVPDSANA